MSEQFQITARTRVRTGTNPVRRLRREGDIPAVIYGGGKDNVSIAINHNMLFHNLENESFHYAIIEINTDGKKDRVVLRDIQKHPYKPVIMHADFMRVSDKQLLTMTVPIHFIGEEDCAGVKQEGGVISRLINEIEVVCLPKDLPEALELDVSVLELNQAFHLSDISLPDGVEISVLMHEDKDENDYAVVSVSVPKVAATTDEEELTEDVEEADSQPEETEKPDSQ